MSRNAKRAYSYVRFSTPEQALGDSERRQVEGAQRYAAANNLILDESLRFIDRGLSGYKGHHRKAQFDAFLDLVKTGKVARGSTLIVENLDRLSREDMVTQLKTLIFDLLDHDIIVVTLSPPDKFTRETLNDGGIFRLIGYMQMGHAESAKKAERLAAAWRNKRKLVASGKLILTKRIPAWLEIKDGRFVLIPNAAETIRWMFQLKLEGFGKGLIAQKLNESASWFPKKNRNQRTGGWRESYIEKICRTRAVIGEFQPHRLDNGKRIPDGEPISGYYPRIITPDVFNAVQKRYMENAKLAGHGGGKNGKLCNVLRHLVVCGYCGGPMAFVYKGQGVRGGRYLVCDGARRGAKECVRHHAKYAEAETSVLDNCTKLRPELILPDTGEQLKESKRIRTRLDGLRAEQTRIEHQKKNLAANLARITDSEFLALCQKQFADLRAKHTEVGVELGRAQAELDGLERGRDSFGEWQKNLAGLKGAIAKDADTRLRLNAHLREFIDKIEVFARGHSDDVERADDYISEVIPCEAAKPFRKYVSSRLLSEDGRCFRIHYKFSAAHRESIAKTLGKRAYKGMQIAPPGSLAYRVEIRGKEMHFYGPQVGLLQEAFFDHRKPGFVPKANALIGGRIEFVQKAARRRLAKA